jgi:hypothetical protein
LTLVKATANRLRLLQIDFAELSPEERMRYLSEEIGRALKTVVPQQRQEFLKGLSEHFPTWENGREREMQAQPVSAFDEAQLNDASFLVERLSRLGPSLGETARRVVVDQLKSAGFEMPVSTSLPTQAAEALSKKLAVSGLDPARVLDLVALLYETITSLDQLVWQTWQAISAQSGLKRPAPLKRTIGAFASGDQDVPRGQVSQDLDSLRKLTAALVSAIGQAGKQFAADHVSKFSPSEIQSLVELERKFGPFSNKEVYCWRKYVELRGGIDEVSVEREITRAIADFAEKLIRGLAR